MRQLLLLFINHPASVGETYFEHLRTAGGFGLRMMGGGIACLLHALLPWCCTHTGSDQVKRLHERMSARRRGPAPPDDGLADSGAYI